MEILVADLARKLGMPSDELCRLLTSMGFGVYRSRNDIVPVDIAHKVRQALAARGHFAPADPVTMTEAMAEPRPQAVPVDIFRQAMSVAGDQPLASPPRPRPQKEKRPTPRKGPAPAQGTQAVPGAATAKDAPTAPSPQRGGAPAETARKVEPASVPLEMVRLRAENDALKGSIAALEAERSTLLEDRERFSRDKLVALEAAERRASAVAAEADRLRALTVPVSLTEAFRRRGTEGVDEVRRGMQALLETGTAREVLANLSVSGDERIGEILSRNLCLSCGRPGCEPPSPLVALVVPPERCELCGGATASRLFRLLNDACLLTGTTRLVFAGGREAIHRWIREGLDRRVQVRSYPGVELFPPERLAEVRAWAQFVVTWCPSSAVGATLESGSPPEGRVGGMSAGLVLSHTARWIDGLVSMG